MHNLLEMPLALAAGVLTIASPCVLPMLPILLGVAVGGKDRSRPLFIVAGFIVAFAAFAMLLGAVSSTVHVAQDVLRNTAIGLLALSGLLRIWPQPYDWLMARMPQFSGVPVVRDGKGGAFVLGMSLGAVWTPCAGPVLAAILALVVKAQDLSWSAALLTSYAIGAGVPMLAIIYGGQFMTGRVRAVSRHAQRIGQVFGVLVMLTALAIYLQYDIAAYAALSSLF